MNARLYKTYVNLSNIIIRISDGTERGKASAVLINSHLDSTLPSPGAADDALAVGVMLECARVLVETKGWEPTYSIIFRACLKRLSPVSPKDIYSNSVQQRGRVFARRLSFVLNATSYCSYVSLSRPPPLASDF